jgi:transcriptional regulator with XRE-family HTH domain
VTDVGEELSLAVARRLGELRRERGWSMERLADEADLHRTSIGLIERGRRGITIAVAARIASALGSQLSDVVRVAESAPRSHDL